MSKLQKEAPSPIDPKKKKYKDGIDFDVSWNSAPADKDKLANTTGADPGERMKFFDFGKLDDFEFDTAFGKVPSFKMDMPDLDFSSPKKTPAKSKEASGGEAIPGKPERKTGFSFSFDFNELDSFDIDRKTKKEENKIKKRNEDQGLDVVESEIDSFSKVRTANSLVSENHPGSKVEIVKRDDVVENPLHTVSSSPGEEQGKNCMQVDDNSPTKTHDPISSATFATEKQKSITQERSISSELPKISFSGKTSIDQLNTGSPLLLALRRDKPKAAKDSGSTGLQFLARNKTEATTIPKPLPALSKRKTEAKNPSHQNLKGDTESSQEHASIIASAAKTDEKRGITKKSHERCNLNIQRHNAVASEKNAEASCRGDDAAAPSKTSPLASLSSNWERRAGLSPSLKRKSIEADPAISSSPKRVLQPVRSEDFQVSLESSAVDLEFSTLEENDGNIEKAEACAKELENICSMLRKKHEEAKELLVRAIVTNNSLLMLDHPLYEEKIHSLQRLAAAALSRKLGD